MTSRDLDKDRVRNRVLTRLMRDIDRILADRVAVERTEPLLEVLQRTAADLAADPEEAHAGAVIQLRVLGLALINLRQACERGEWGRADRCARRHDHMQRDVLWMFGLHQDGPDRPPRRPA